MNSIAASYKHSNRIKIALVLWFDKHQMFVHRLVTGRFRLDDLLVLGLT